MKTLWRSRLSDSRLISIGLLLGLGLIYLPTLSHAFVWDDLTFVQTLWPLRAPAFWWTAVQQPFPIAPGYFMTELNRTLVENVEFNKWICGRTPAGRWGQPEELAGAAVFLASRASDFVNGQILTIDGGLLAAL